MKNVFTLLLIAITYLASAHADTTNLKLHLSVLTQTTGYRNYKNTKLLDNTANYIFNHFKRYADTVYFQEYSVDNRLYKNVVGVFGKDNSQLVVVGAHYDVCGNQEGADDNASGVAGLLELARQLKNQKTKYRIELVSYTLEEPPYFRTESMGSYVHAKSLADKKSDVYGMISLEMIGFFKDSKKTQSYPLGFLSLMYGKRGNYITLVNKFEKGRFARKFSRTFKREKTIITKKFIGPKSLTGIDFLTI